MKAITLFTVSVITSALFFLTASASNAQKEAPTVDWSKIKATNSRTLDNLTDQVKQAYDKVFLMDALAKRIESQLDGTTPVTDIDKLIDEIELFMKETENLAKTGGILLEMATDENIIKKVKGELSPLKYLRALKNTATLIKAAKIITEKSASMFSSVIPGLKDKALAIKKAKAKTETTSKR